MKFKKGDLVVLNDRYYEFYDHIGETYTCTSDSWVIDSGEEVVLLDRDFKGGYSVDGLDPYVEIP